MYIIVFYCTYLFIIEIIKMFDEDSDLEGVHAYLKRNFQIQIKFSKNLNKNLKNKKWEG